MKALAFVIWIIGWPLSVDLCMYMKSTYAKVEPLSQSAGLMFFMIWVIVAIMVWEMKT